MRLRPEQKAAYRVAVIPGDGIGKEVVPAAVEVVTAAAKSAQVQIEFLWRDWSAANWLKGDPIIPADGLGGIEGCDAILFGAHGASGVPDHIAAWQFLFAIRQAFDQYANVRPICLYPGVQAPIRMKPATTIDLVIVRENIEGEFAGPGGVSGRGTPVEMATQLTMISRYGTERIARYAFELARTRRNRVTSITKSNSMPHALGYWDQVIREVASTYPDVEHRSIYVDAAAALFVSRPESFDIVLGTTLYGDILSDLGAALVGGLGIAPSGNVNPERRYPSLFEPIHGSAPDIAGKGIANPVGAMLAGAMMLDHVGLPNVADHVRAAVFSVLAGGRCRTSDLGGTATTSQFAAAVIGSIGIRPKARAAV